MMRLSALLQGVSHTAPAGHNPDVRDLCYDSRQAGAGSAFVCLPGARTDGHLYAPSAYDRGCRVFICERPIDLPADALQVVTGDARAALADMAGNLFDHPARALSVIGVTGTKGKTTVSHLIAHILEAAGVKTGLIGTTGIRYGDVREKTVNTTPESYPLQKAMRQMADDECGAVCMEVSSQALMTGRVRGISFDTGVFTNLSPDHIGPGEHRDFDHYASCKARLFAQSAHAVVNADDPHAAMMAAKAAGPVTRVGIQTPADYTARGIRLMREPSFLGAQFTCRTPEGDYRLEVNQPGAFSVVNALLAVAATRRMGTPMDVIGRALSTVRIPGRVELVPAFPWCTVIIDYAHNEASLRAVLETLRAYEPRRLVCLFGAVGGRTQLRREAMARVAAACADFCILTSDNPDFEDPLDILNDLERGMGEAEGRFISIADRESAVKYAVDTARPGDIILLAGKGHEDYQLIRGERVPFDERSLVRDAASARLRREEAVTT